MLLKIVKIALCVIVAFALVLVCGCLSGFASLSVSQYFWPMEPDSSFGDGVIPGVMMLSSMVVGFFGGGLIVLRMLLKRLVDGRRDRRLRLRSLCSVLTIDIGGLVRDYFRGVNPLTVH